MKVQLGVLTKLVRAEDKIRGEYSTLEEIQEGMEEMYDILTLINPRIRLNSSYIQVYEDLKHLESREIFPKEFSISDLLRDLVRYN